MTIDQFRNNILKPFYLFTYRSLALLLLSTALIFIVGWGFVILFFMFNTTWVAPTVLTQTSDHMLQFSSGLEQAIQTAELDKVAVHQSERDLQYAIDNVKMLQQIQEHLMKYSKQSDSTTGEKNHQLSKSQELATELDSIKQKALDSRKAGLIDNVTLAQMSTFIQEFENTLTDSRQQLSTLGMNTEAQTLQVVEQLRLAQNDVHTKQEMVLASRTALNVAERTLASLQSSVYYSAFMNDKSSNLAFMAYGNIRKARVGAPVYDCLLQMVICHQVGTIRHVYKDEQIFDFPLFNVKLSRTERGFFVDMDMTNSDAMRNTVLFIDKPLWF